jgi:hypothetical protein
MEGNVVDGAVEAGPLPDDFGPPIGNNPGSCLGYSDPIRGRQLSKLVKARGGNANPARANVCIQYCPD